MSTAQSTTPYSPFTALLAAIDRFKTHEISAKTLLESYGHDYFAVSQLVAGDNPKAQAFRQAVQLVVLNTAACERQWADLADSMAYLQPIFYRDAEVNQLHLVLLGFPAYSKRYHQLIPGVPQRLPGGVYLEN